MTAGDNKSVDPAVRAAAEWLASDQALAIDRPAVPELRRRFGLSAPEAVDAIRIARNVRWRAA
jgi:hypothetical protein